jgi:hypothetical protein
MNAAALTEVQPPQDKSGQKKSWRETWILPIVVALIAVVPSVLGFWGGWATAGEPEAVPTELDADKALALDRYGPGALHEVSGPVMRISGVLKGPLPSGATIWVATRTKEESQGDPAIRAAGVGLANGPCDVDAAGKTFNCGEVRLGGLTETGDYFVYVLLAESSVARDFVRVLFDQKENNNYRHYAPPAGISVLGPVEIKRTK